MNKKIIKLTSSEMQKKIKGNKNISYKRLRKFLLAFQIILRKILMQDGEINFGNFVRLGPRIAKDRIVITREIKSAGIKSEKKHMPQHLRFKAFFRQEFKDYLNNG